MSLTCATFDSCRLARALRCTLPDNKKLQYCCDYGSECSMQAFCKWHEAVAAYCTLPGAGMCDDAGCGCAQVMEQMAGRAAPASQQEQPQVPQSQFQHIVPVQELLRH